MVEENAAARSMQDRNQAKLDNFDEMNADLEAKTIKLKDANDYATAIGAQIMVK